MLFGGTAVSQGSCIAIVTDIGMTTEIGKIQAQIQAAAQVRERAGIRAPRGGGGRYPVLMHV